MLIDDDLDQRAADLIGQKVSQSADITDDPIVAPHRISFKQYVRF
jgi:hypothetical protein